MEMLGIVENMNGLKCPHCGKMIDLFMSNGGKKMAEKTGVEYLTSLPIEPEVVKMADMGKLAELDQKGITFSEEFKKMVDRVIEKTA